MKYVIEINAQTTGWWWEASQLDGTVKDGLADQLEDALAAASAAVADMEAGAQPAVRVGKLVMEAMQKETGTTGELGRLQTPELNLLCAAIAICYQSVDKEGQTNNNYAPTDAMLQDWGPSTEPDVEVLIDMLRGGRFNW